MATKSNSLIKATKLNGLETAVYKTLLGLNCFQKYMEFACDTACLSGKTRRQMKSETLEHLRLCVKIIVRNQNIEAGKIYGWWFGYKGFNKPRGLVLT